MMKGAEDIREKGVKPTNGFYNYGSTPKKTTHRILTGNKKFDNFFSHDGGMIRGSAVLFTGSSGAGKTTQSVFLQAMLPSLKTALYSREMWASKVAHQCKGLNVFHDNAYIADVESAPHFDNFMKHLQELAPDVAVVDSLQVIAREDFPNMSESDAIYHIIKTLREWNTKNNSVLFVIGHVTKNDIFRGDNTIMQMFDAHLEMIYHKKTGNRTISWGQKNRDGDVNQMLYYDFAPSGLVYYTPQEWMFVKQDISLSDAIEDAMRDYLVGIKEQKWFERVRLKMKKKETLLEKEFAHDNARFIAELFVAINQTINEEKSKLSPEN